MEAIILAGGRGERLNTVVPDVPKPMAPIKGRPFLEHLMDYWIGQGISRFVVAVGHKHELIEKRLGVAYGGARLAYSVEEELLGTGGGLVRAASCLENESPFLVLNGDTFFEIPLANLKNEHLKKKSDWSIVLVEAAPGSRYAEVLMNADGRISEFGSQESKRGSGLSNGGVYLIESRRIFEAFGWDGKRKLSLESELVPGLIALGKRFFGFQWKGRFIDIGVPEDYYRACNEFFI